MGAKPRAKPVLVKDLIAGADNIGIGLENWEVIRRLHPGHKTKTFAMAIVKAQYQQITRGPNKGGERMTLVVEYLDRKEEPNGRQT